MPANNRKVIRGLRMYTDDYAFLIYKLLRDFYQYCMNSLDSINQIANDGLQENNGKKVDAVDFQRMVSTFASQTNKISFPKTSSLIVHFANI